MDIAFINPCTDAQFAQQSVAYTGTAGSTTGWPVGPQGVMVWSDQACYVEVGTGATATTASTSIPANQAFGFKIPPGSTTKWRVSAIQVSTGGTIYCKPLNAA